MQRPDYFLWDGATDGDETEAALSMCITASPAAFALVSGVLADYVLRFPNREMQPETDRAIYNIDQAQRDAIIHIMLEMNRQIECGESDTSMFQLRQNPVLPCLLEQSFDGGDTWTTAYDFTACVPDSPGTLINNYNTSYQQVSYYVDQFTENYTDSVGDLYPVLVYDATGDDDYRDSALCYAIGEFVRFVCESALKFYDELDGLLNAVKIGAAIAAAIGAIIGLATGGIAAAPFAGIASSATAAAAGIALGAAIGEALYTLVTTNERSTWLNPTARNEVTCAIYLVLKGQDVDFDDFQNALDGITFSGDAIGIGAYAAMLMQEVATYANFIPMLEQAYRSAQAGLLPPCDCDSGDDFSYTIYQGFGDLTVITTGTGNFGDVIDVTFNERAGGTPLTPRPFEYSIHFNVNVHIDWSTTDTPANANPGEICWLYTDDTNTQLLATSPSQNWGNMPTSADVNANIGSPTTTYNMNGLHLTAPEVHLLITAP